MQSQQRTYLLCACHRYVRGDERVNQKWLKRALEERPCVVANAIIHYQVWLAPFAFAVCVRATVAE